jgi:hypothetical protein
VPRVATAGGGTQQPIHHITDRLSRKAPFHVRWF